MTSKNSLCIKCAKLEAASDALCIPARSKEPRLISTCLHGGVNAGNRKQCKNFEPAVQWIIEMRLDVFKRHEKVIEADQAEE